MIYVDTSLLLPTYLPEVHSARANEVLKSSSALFLSDLVVAELHVSTAARGLGFEVLPAED